MKNTLYLIGMGLCDELDLSSRSIETLKKCDKVFAENYTNLMKDKTLNRLEKIIGKKIELLAREEVEGEKKIIDAFENDDKFVAFLVPGDPMSATTHSSLLQAAKKNKIDAKVLHASSIFSAAPGAAGLQNYKFGKTATITYWRKNFEPTSFLDVICANKKIDAHTLCLLDIDVQMGPMKPSQALEVLNRAQEKKIVAGEIKEKIILPDSKIFVLWHVGWEDEKVWAGEIRDYKNLKNEKEGPAIIIICAKMHFAEEESFENANTKK
ncbi:MAG: diphthine synthase [Candidatus Micrarchaeia archaeon]